MKENKSKFKIFIALAVCIVTIGCMATLTWAFFEVVTGDEDPNVFESPNLSVEYTDTSDIILENAYTGDSITKTFKIKNTGNAMAILNISLKNVQNNFAVKSDLVYEIKYSDETENLISGIIPSTDEVLADKIFVPAGKEESFEMIITFKRLDTDQTSNMGKTFIGTIAVDNSDFILPIMNVACAENTYSSETFPGKIISNNCAYAYNKPSPNVIYENGIDFDYVSGYINGNGLYYVDGDLTEDLDTDGAGERSYFFRGNDLNNHVIFGGFCWKIIRINEDGSVRMFYDGTPENDKCSKERTISTPKGKFTNASGNAGAGYMYGSDTSNNYEDTHRNTNSSLAKNSLDSWYESNIKNTSIESLIADAIYCNDRKTSNNGYQSHNSSYVITRLNVKNPMLKCSQTNDKFTVDSESGNKSLTYPIGLITIDELIFAGNRIKKTGRASETKAYYSFLTGYEEYWTMSPSEYNSSMNMYFGGYNSSVKSSDIDTLKAYHPVISIKSQVNSISGAGSEIDPYKID